VRFLSYPNMLELQEFVEFACNITQQGVELMAWHEP
jgi:hypothetical protein